MGIDGWRGEAGWVTWAVRIRGCRGVREKTQGDSGERERGSIKSIQSKPKTRKCDEMHKGVKRCFLKIGVFLILGGLQDNRRLWWAGHHRGERG